MPQTGARDTAHHAIVGEKNERGIPLSYGNVGRLLLVLDFLAIVATSTLAGAGYHLITFGHVGVVQDFFGAGCVTAALFVAVLQARGLYRPSPLLGRLKDLVEVFVVWTGVFAFLASAAFMLKISGNVSRGSMTLFFFAGLATTMIGRRLASHVLRHAIARGALSGQRTILVVDREQSGRNPLFGGLVQHGYRIRSVFPLTLASAAGLSQEDERTITELVSFARGHHVDEVLILADWSKLAKIREIAARLQVLPLPVRLVADSGVQDLISKPIVDLGPASAVELQRAPLSLGERAAKRALDVLVSGAALVVLAPLLVVVAAAVRCETPGPVLFRQTRVGFNGRPFRIFKFRTMTVQDDGPVVRQATRRDVRVTQVGGWLRRSSIDELPQLLNVLGGEMSLVGPRPHAAAHDTEFDSLIANYALRHHVKPGITGWAQVKGWRGETDTQEKLQGRVEADLWYINNWSLFLDLRILAMTAVGVMRGANAY